jgi:predicted GTPase
MARKKVIILGAAGRDFHNFNVLFRENREYEVVAFTANQIPYISGRRYPRELSGPLYPNGIGIYDESELESLIDRHGIDICMMAYSDLPDVEVMEKASIANAHGADFWLASPGHTMIRSRKPVFAVCAVRTGSGKSQTSRYVAKFFNSRGIRVAIVRHPMPYGVLRDEIVERFATLKDLDRFKATIEEREEYETHIRNGFVVFAGVDYEKILRAAEKEADVILWDGGNNDASFYKPDFLITVADPLRAGNEMTYYPGETVVRMADLLLVNKVNTATKTELTMLVDDLKSINDKGAIVYADSVVSADGSAIKGKRVLVVEDGPTITHGGMRIGAGTIAARKYRARSIVFAKDYAVGTIKDTFDKYRNLGQELPAMGYSKRQIKDLEETINNARCDVVVSATPIDLSSLVKANKPIVKVTYELMPRGRGLDRALKRFVDDFIG